MEFTEVERVRSIPFFFFFFFFFRRLFHFDCKETDLWAVGRISAMYGLTELVGASSSMNASTSHAVGDNSTMEVCVPLVSMLPTSISIDVMLIRDLDSSFLARFFAAVLMTNKPANKMPMTQSPTAVPITISNQNDCTPETLTEMMASGGVAG